MRERTFILRGKFCQEKENLNFEEISIGGISSAREGKTSATGDTGIPPSKGEVERELEKSSSLNGVLSYMIEMCLLFLT